MRPQNSHRFSRGQSCWWTLCPLDTKLQCSSLRTSWAHIYSVMPHQHTSTFTIRCTYTILKPFCTITTPTPATKASPLFIFCHSVDMDSYLNGSITRLVNYHFPAFSLYTLLFHTSIIPCSFQSVSASGSLVIASKQITAEVILTTKLFVT